MVQDPTELTLSKDATGADLTLNLIAKEGSETVTWNNLPIGTYTVVEDETDAAIAGYMLAVTYDKTEVTVSRDNTATATVTNTYTEQPGSLKLTKAVTVDNAALNAANKTLADGTSSFTVASTTPATPI